jgi:hypothetical protein
MLLINILFTLVTPFGQNLPVLVFNCNWSKFKKFLLLSKQNKLNALEKLVHIRSFIY